MELSDMLRTLASRSSAPNFSFSPERNTWEASYWQKGVNLHLTGFEAFEDSVTALYNVIREANYVLDRFPRTHEEPQNFAPMGDTDGLVPRMKPVVEDDDEVPF